MFSKLLLTMGLFLVVAAEPASAMMGGSGAGGALACGQGQYMQENMNEMMGDGNMGSHGYHYGQENQIYPNSQPGGPGGMNQQTAEAMAQRYMQNNYSDTWSFGSRTDNGSYYMTDVMGPDGKLIDRLLIDKRSGNVHSLGPN